MGSGGYAPVAPPVQMYVQTSNTLQLPTQMNVNDPSMRDPQLANASLERLKFATRNLQTPEQAYAAGYRPNPSAPDHWINDEIFRVRNGYDLDAPATIMFENGKLVGVMLSHNPKQGNPPDLGAGTWHTHPGATNEEYAAHVWFNRPFAKSFSTEIGDV